MSKTNLMPTRRTILRTAAWTAPAISLAVASPAFAGTQQPPTPGTTSSALPTGSNNQVVMTTNLSTSTGFTGTITATVQVTVAKNAGNSLAPVTVSVSDSSWVATNGTSLPTFQRTDLPAGTTAFSPTFTLGAGNWDSLTIKVTFTAPGMQSFTVDHVYVK